MMPRPMNPTAPPSNSATSLLLSFLSQRPVTHLSQPGERGLRALAWPVFEADPAIVARVVERLEHEGVIDLASAWLVSCRAICNLDVTDLVDAGSDRRREVPTHPLRVV